METKKVKLPKLECFKKLWKTKKALECEDHKELWQHILKEYWTKCCKPQWSITWKDLADRVFSEYVRLHYADKDGMCICVTCNTKLPRKQIQNGHFVSRGVMKYRFDIRNCHPQCYKCNCLLNWNYKPYTVYMVKEYWMDVVLIMIWDRTLKEYKQYEYEEMIIQWYKEIQEMKRKIKWNKKE